MAIIHQQTNYRAFAKKTIATEARSFCPEKLGVALPERHMASTMFTIAESLKETLRGRQLFDCVRGG
ncbi:MAG: hypothetical protein JST46_17425 [Bacteroidetes bacterium]|nr:hypothetical protein [Bacteroidota bacterium]